MRVFVALAVMAVIALAIQADEDEKAAVITNHYRQYLSLRRQGRLEEGLKHLKKIVEIDPLVRGAWYEMACCYAELGKSKKAVEALERAIKTGILNFRMIENEKRLAKLRETKEYKALMKQRTKLAKEGIRTKVQFYKNLLGQGYLYEVLDKERFALILGVPKKEYEKVKKRLKELCNGLRKLLFERPPDTYITVIVVSSLEDWTGKLRNSVRSAGGYSPEDMVLSVRTLRALFHEFTHALHFADQDALKQKHPAWICEGLACLFEAFKKEKGKVVGISNHRLGRLKKEIKEGSVIPWRRLFRMKNSEFMRRADSAYAVSGFIMRYLQEKGLLSRWYKEYTEHYKDDPTGAKALEKVLGCGLDEAERRWKEWVAQQSEEPKFFPGD